jgi:2-hydroxy-6-oxonona-2,4-dienedioate hydrolase
MTFHSVWDVVDGMRVHGRVSPRATNGGVRQPEIVFVHGLGMSTRYLEPTMLAAAAHGFDVSGLDLPGFGESRLPGGEVLSLGELAAALSGWLRARRIESPILVGQSHGCQVIAEAVSRELGLASALLLNAPTMPAEHRSMLAMLWRVALDSPREPLAIVPHVVREYLRAGPKRLLTTLDDALRDRIEDKLPRFEMPVMIVCGARDPVSPPEWGARLTALVGIATGGSAAPATFRSVPGAAHAVPFSHPLVVSGEIAELAARVVGRLPAR